MPDEFDPTVELGLPPDRYVICSCWGFLTRHNDARKLCGRFIEDGEHFFGFHASRRLRLVGVAKYSFGN